MNAPLSIPNLTHHHPFRQWLQWTIPGTDFSLEGYSRAGDKTFFYLPQLSVCLDAGLVEGRKGNHVFLTHCHNDHIADLEVLALRQDVGIHIPMESAADMDEFIHARRKFVWGGGYDRNMGTRHLTIGMRAGDAVEFYQDSRHIKVRTLACDHSVPCLGYAFSEFKKRLLPELEQKKQEMLAAGKQAEFGKMMASLRKEGKELEEEYPAPLFVFMGDTHAGIFAEQDWLWEYPVLITECTYFQPELLEHADLRRHTHWEHLRPHVLAHPGTTFVLTHFSLRSSDAEVIAFFEAEREKYGFENVRVWCSAEPEMRQQGQRPE